MRENTEIGPEDQGRVFLWASTERVARMTPHAAPTVPNTMDGVSPATAPATQPHSPPTIKTTAKISVFFTASFIYSPFHCIHRSVASRNLNKNCWAEAHPLTQQFL
jgi:hypothetical protein